MARRGTPDVDAALRAAAAECADQAGPAPLWADGAEVLLPGADGDGWVRGAVVGGGASGGAVASQELRVRLEGGGEVVRVARSSVAAANPAELERTEDLASLPHLGGQQLLRTLGLRFRRGAIYTRCGPSLLALNPWRPLPLYGAEQLQRCRDHAAATAATPPAHIFAVAAAALRLVAMEASEQTVVVSGESGAGKTETSRRLLQALAACTAPIETAEGGVGGGGGSALLPLLLQALTLALALALTLALALALPLPLALPLSLSLSLSRPLPWSSPSAQQRRRSTRTRPASAAYSRLASRPPAPHLARARHLARASSRCARWEHRA